MRPPHSRPSATGHGPRHDPARVERPADRTTTGLGLSPRGRAWLLGLVAAASWAAPARAGLPEQTVVQLLALEGRLLPGHHSPLAELHHIAVNDRGSWVADGRLANGTNVLIVDGAIVCATGDALAEPAGAVVDDVSYVDIDTAGTVAAVKSWGPSPAGRGVFVDDELVIADGQLVIAPGVALGTRWTGLLYVELNDAGQLLVYGAFDFPAEPFPVPALVLAEVDGSGTLLSERVVVQKGDVLPGYAQPVTSIGGAPDGMTLNGAGQVLFIVNGGVLFLDDVLVARTNDPVPGGTLSSIEGAGLGDDGDVAFRSFVSTTGPVLIAGGDIAASAVAVPAESTTFFAEWLHTIGSNPVVGNGQVLWQGRLAASGPSALYLGDRVLVQDGETSVNGKTVELSFPPRRHAISPNGERVAFLGTLDGKDAAFGIHIGPWASVGLHQTAAALVGSGPLTPGSLATLSLGDVHPIHDDDDAFLVLGLSSIHAPFRGGVLVPSPDVVVPGVPVSEGGTSIPFDVPVGLPAGLTLVFQFWFFESFFGQIFVGWSNAIEGTLP